jgi:hypothetical protein
MLRPVLSWPVSAAWVDDVDERFDLAMRLLRADQLLRDLGRLERAWRRYEREHRPPLAGQLVLF